MAKYGIGASVPRKEDDRFLRGRGQYVGDIRMAGTRDVAFVRSPVAHARLKDINVPKQFRDVVFTAKHLTGVKPIISAPPLKGGRLPSSQLGPHWHHFARGRARMVPESAKPPHRRRHRWA